MSFALNFHRMDFGRQSVHYMLSNLETMLALSKTLRIQENNTYMFMKL